MAKINFLAIGQCKVGKISEQCGIGTVFCILLRYILYKILISFTRQHFPLVIVILFNAGANVGNFKKRCISIMFLSIRYSIPIKNF